MEELIEKLKLYGADMSGAKERFLGDSDLYEICFESFLNDEAFDGLKLSIENQKYKDAFDYAHTLKGVAGNLGLTDIFDAMSRVLEAVRKEEYESVKKLTDKIFEIREVLKELK